MGQVDRVGLAEFTVTTHADEARIRDVATRAMAVAKRAMQSSMKEGSGGPGYQGYLFVGPGGFVKQMAVTLRWEDVGEGKTRVQLKTGEYLTTRPTFMLIPLGPKSVPALGSLERFSKFVKGELEGRVAA